MAKKRHHEEHENLERWLVSYADFITLLFAFFTIMYALSQTDKAKFKNAVENIQRAFQSAGGVYPLKGAPFLPFDRSGHGSAIPPSAVDQGKFSKEEAQGMDRVAEHVKNLFERTTGFSATPQSLEVLKSDQGYKIRLGETLVFAAGSDKLKKEALPFLYEMGKRLAALDLPIMVEGHSDGEERRLAGEEVTSHWQISLARATTMAKFLVDATEFPENKISVVGHGTTFPLAENDSEEGRARNRRVEISIITPDKETEKLPW